MRATRKDTQRRFAAATREQRAAQEEVRAANARVVEQTSKLPAHYVDRRFAPGERERIEKLIEHAQKASNRLASATATVVNLRALGMDIAAPRARASRSHMSKLPPTGLIDLIRAGSRVTIVDRFGKRHTGRAIMRGSYGWVLNMGGRHGTPGIATESNLVSVRGR